jgi:hypothetical protein
VSLIAFPVFTPNELPGIDLKAAKPSKNHMMLLRKKILRTDEMKVKDGLAK